MKSILAFFDALCHRFLLKISKRYLQATLVAAQLKIIRDEIARKRDCDPYKVKQAVGQLLELDHNKFMESLELLADSGMYALMDYAVELSPKLGKKCGDENMTWAWHNLRLCNCVDHACWARTQLTLAEKWYRAAHALTPDLKEKINVGLAKVQWVVDQGHIRA